jgi:hypothetical protein
VIVAVPAVIKVRAPSGVMVQTPVVSLVKVTGSAEVEDAVRVGAVPKFWALTGANVMVCGALGVTEFDAAEAELVPTLLVAVTVKV